MDHMNLPSGKKMPWIKCTSPKMPYEQWLLLYMFFTRFEYFDGFYVDGPSHNEWYFSPPMSELHPLVRMLKRTPFIGKVTYAKNWPARRREQTKYLQDRDHPKHLNSLLTKNDIEYATRRKRVEGAYITQNARAHRRP
jgi:hypothetical protein